MLEKHYRGRRRRGQIGQRNNNQYFVASEHGSEAAPQRGRGEQSAQGFGKAALLPIFSGLSERNKIKFLLRSQTIYVIIKPSERVSLSRCRFPGPLTRIPILYISSSKTTLSFHHAAQCFASSRNTATKPPLRRTLYATLSRLPADPPRIPDLPRKHQRTIAIDDLRILS